MARDCWIFDFQGWHEADEILLCDVGLTEYRLVLFEDVLAFGDVDILEAKDQKYRFLYIVELGNFISPDGGSTVLVRSLPELYLLMKDIAPAKWFMQEYEVEFKRERRKRREEAERMGIKMFSDRMQD